MGSDPRRRCRESQFRNQAGGRRHPYHASELEGEIGIEPIVFLRSARYDHMESSADLQLDSSDVRMRANAVTPGAAEFEAVAGTRGAFLIDRVTVESDADLAYTASHIHVAVGRRSR